MSANGTSGKFLFRPLGFLQPLTLVDPAAKQQSVKCSRIRDSEARPSLHKRTYYTHIHKILHIIDRKQNSSQHLRNNLLLHNQLSTSYLLLLFPCITIAAFLAQLGTGSSEQKGAEFVAIATIFTPFYQPIQIAFDNAKLGFTMAHRVSQLAPPPVMVSRSHRRLVAPLSNCLSGTKQLVKWKQHDLLLF